MGRLASSQVTDSAVVTADVHGRPLPGIDSHGREDNLGHMAGFAKGGFGKGLDGIFEAHHATGEGRHFSDLSGLRQSIPQIGLHLGNQLSNSALL